MGLAEYMIISKPDGWTVLHDGTAQHDYDTKEAAFEAAVAAASVAIRQGHEVHVSVPGHDAGNKTALGAKELPQRAVMRLGRVATHLQAPTDAAAGPPRVGRSNAVHLPVWVQDRSSPDRVAGQLAQ